MCVCVVRVGEDKVVKAEKTRLINEYILAIIIHVHGLRDQAKRV
jgi:hypothetical protein